MAIVRCNNHPVKLYRATNRYAMRAEPIGFPTTAAICGISGCTEPGLVWLTTEEKGQFNKGERFFNVKTFTIKVKITDKSLPLP